MTGISVAGRQHISRIKEQPDSSHGELVRERFLARWEYRKAASQQDYIMTYWPGHKFFEDQQAREIRRQLEVLNAYLNYHRSVEPSKLLDFQMDELAHEYNG